MRTVLLNCSPKKRMSTSGYCASLMRLFVRGGTVTESLRTAADTERILSTLTDADALVFFVPMYIDCLPSHVCAFLARMETYAHEHSLHCRIYAVSNGGFIEGIQNRPVLDVLRNFAARAALPWGGGVGIGGGVMLGVVRVLFVLEAVLLFLNLVLSQSAAERGAALLSSAVQFLVLLVLIGGVLLSLARLGQKIRRGADAGARYTRILLPSFVFIIVADLFFLVISLLHGGLFRGWLKKK